MRKHLSVEYVFVIFAKKFSHRICAILLCNVAVLYMTHRPWQIGRSFGLLCLYRIIPYRQLVSECMYLYCLFTYFFICRGQYYVFLTLYFANSSAHILHSHMLPGWSQFRFVVFISEHTLSATGRRVYVLFAKVFFSFPGANIIHFPRKVFC